MRATSVPDLDPLSLRRTLDRLDGLPVRPLTARQSLASVPEADPTADAPEESVPVPVPASAETDPAWALARSRARDVNPLGFLAAHRWWPGASAKGPAAEALGRLWRFSTAVGFAARRLAREAGRDDPDAVARAGVLHGLGLWAVASVAPERLIGWFARPDPASRRDLERSWIGTEASALGRALAERWGAEPLVVDAAWLHADLSGDLNGCAADPGRLALVQEAYALALKTPWAPGSEESREAGPGDPRVKILTAEVQSRCIGAFVDPEATSREESLTRENARLRQALARLRDEGASRERFVRAVAESSATETPDRWAERAGLALCGEPGVSAARVAWSGVGSGPGTEGAGFPLGGFDRPCALVRLEGPEGAPPPPPPETLGAWDAWARAVDERARLGERLDAVVAAHRGRVDREGPARRRALLEALAEFAAGAGHELNNPLAVILGRAQILLSRKDDPEDVRMLRAIIAQAQRAHRILRDLMYVARPPEARPRPCQPDEIVRASLRDLQGEAEARGVRVVAEAREPGPRVWADPEPLRQLADILVRNALEATPAGGSVRFTAGGDPRTLRWTVHDTGRGIGATEGLHLFDPFYCGRQAGRGLGLGLPRAARIVELAGGDLRWQSIPGTGTTFQVAIPLAEIPPSPAEEPPAGLPGPRALPIR